MCKGVRTPCLAGKDALPSALFAVVTKATVLADALPPTLLALRALPAVRTDALPSAILTSVTLAAVLTNTLPSALLALKALSAVLTDALSPALLAPTANATVFADALPSAILAVGALSAVLTETIPSTLFAPRALSAVLAHRPTPALLARGANPSMQTEDPSVPVPLDFSCVLSLLPPSPHPHACTPAVSASAVLAVSASTAEQTEVPFLEMHVPFLLSPSSYCFPRADSPLRFPLQISSSRVICI
uniref:Uncharacterized protein n=1 Tax=Chromera velia CCMP2878 TaxID=1169474 RepID=A0A0G4I1J0_9ALVE|eukprot:Cvel_10173.t1-p1 / transcript=Cvel_10173.t1 / gene=Cvel_10173 / organism=Chromera_velia_CCMP2878 / gene_product=Zinc finger protein 283, putative / transcript_product=Zinc finger protein 283, putative / location=Cvel_scaffold607:42375-46450(+) / protein_length=245 / sequence_SO=supercontig / SO=protein_coding / is_pseudo=false